MFSTVSTIASGTAGDLERNMELCIQVVWMNVCSEKRRKNSLNIPDHLASLWENRQMEVSSVSKTITLFSLWPFVKFLNEMSWPKMNATWTREKIKCGLTRQWETEGHEELEEKIWDLMRRGKRRNDGITLMHIIEGSLYSLWGHGWVYRWRAMPKADLSLHCSLDI